MHRRSADQGFNAFDLLADEEGDANEDEWAVVAKKAQAKKGAPDLARAAPQQAGKAKPKPAAAKPAAAAAAAAADVSKVFVEDYYRAFQHVYSDPRSHEVVLRFHKTNVVRINRNGHVMLTTGGWFTYTTLAAINDALQAINMRVVHHGEPGAGVWSVKDDQGHHYHFEDGMVIPASKPEDKYRGKTVLEAYHGGAEVPRYAHKQQPGAVAAQQQQQQVQTQQRARAVTRNAATTAGQPPQAAAATVSYASAVHAARGTGTQQQHALAMRPTRPSKPARQQLAEAVEQLNMQDEIDGGDEHLCVVCLENHRDEVLVPCGHMVLCKGCCKNIMQGTNECPVCREVIVDHCTIGPAHESGSEGPE